MIVTGTIHEIKDEEAVTDRFRKRELWLKLDKSFGDTIVTIEFVQGWVQTLDKHNIGDKVEVAFNLQGREYKGRVYNSLRGYTIQTIP